MSIEFIGVTRRFGSVVALDRVDLVAHSGELGGHVEQRNPHARSRYLARGNGVSRSPILSVDPSAIQDTLTSCGRCLTGRFTNPGGRVSEMMSQDFGRRRATNAQWNRDPPENG